jgi:hypothetical protein
MSSTKISRGMRETVASICAGKTAMWGEETHWACVSAGLLSCADGVYACTPEGANVAKAELARAEQRRASRNSAARSRASVMKSLGLTRTAYGWE